MHIMLDLETFGTRPGCVVRSIGAVAFDLSTGKIHSEFYRNIDERSCLDAGLFIEPDTAAWWQKQSPAARDALLVDPLPLRDVVDSFRAWFQLSAGQEVWGQGADFDQPIWREACRAVRARVPWKYNMVRDTRTAYALFDFDYMNALKREGTYHNALDDAKHQVACLFEGRERRRPPLPIDLTARGTLMTPVPAPNS